MSCQGPIAENWIHVKMRKGVSGGFEAGKDSRRERREAERNPCRAPRFAKKKDDGRAEASTKGTFAGLQNRERGRTARDGKEREEESERVSGWFIESLSGAARWICARKKAQGEGGAGGGAFI